MKTLIAYWRENQNLILAWIAGLILLLQVLNLHSYVVQMVDHQAIVAVNDDDASWNVAKTVKTRWWKDNGWVLYGPGYFRLNHSIQYFWGRTADPRNEGDHENWERTAHHAILTISLLSIVGIALIIACHLLLPWWQRLLFSFGFVAAFVSVPAYTEFILRAHPDMLFAFLAVAALALTIRMLAQPAEKLWFVASACLWGFSVSAKMTLSLCAPGFLLLFIPPFKKPQWRRGLKYLGVMLLAYFLIGFPQTIVLDRPFRAMMKIGGLSAPVTADSVVHWLSLYGQQLFPILAVIALACFDFNTRKWPSFKDRWRVLLFVTLPFLILLTKNMQVPADHYTVAFVSMFALYVAMYFRPPFAHYFSRRHEYPLLRGFLFLAVILAGFGSTPRVLQDELNKWMKCRMEARDLYMREKSLYEQGANLWVDPYTPYLTDAPKSRLEVSWEKSWKGYEQGGWTALVLNLGFRSRFTGAQVDDYTKNDIGGWEGAREFYMAFTHGDEARTPQGHIFKKAYQNACGHELWLKQ